MSNLYNLEPQPTAKAILHTTAGDVLLELFAHQTPLACRNFLQLCLDGYYDGTIFHRLVPSFIIQGGDPTGTGAGGESSFEGGEPFKDEFHSRLKFNRRGLLGMANTGERDDNGSQFFLTLGKTDELTGKNTMFGRVVGDTIFNLVKLGEAELTEEEGSERPLYPTKITGTEVLVNPFEDMVKRVRVALRVEEDRAPKRKAKKKTTKTLLSFDDEQGDGEAVLPLTTKKFNPALVDTATNDSLSRAPKRAAPDSAAVPPPKRRGSPPQQAPTSTSSKPEHRLPRPKRSAASPSPTPSPEPDTRESKEARDRTAAEIASLKSSLRRTIASDSKPVEPARKKSALEAMIPATSIKGRRRHLDSGANVSGSTAAEQRALAEFKEFRRKLDAANILTPRNGDLHGSVDPDSTSTAEEPLENSRAENAPPVEEDEEANLCDLHFVANCESCRSWARHDTDATYAEDGTRLETAGEDDETGWMAHTLTFEKDRKGKDLEWKRQNEKELVVIDPREKEKALKEENRSRKERSRA